MPADVCPPDWQEVPLTSVADASFSSVDKKSHAGELPVRLCNYVDVYKNEYVTGDLLFMRATATRSEIAQFGLRLGDVIITKDSETPDDIGIAALVDYAAPDMVCGYHLAMLRPKANRVAPAFLAKQLRHPRLARYFGQQANGLTRYGLPKAAVENAPLWIPREPKEGEKIADILRQLDAAIRETEAVVAKLKQVKAGLLHDLLTRGLDEHGQLRDPARHPEQFQVTRFGELPKEWSEGSFGSLVSEVSLGTARHGTSANDENIPLLKMGNLTWGDWDLRKVEYLNASAISRQPELVLQPDDFLFNTRNTPELVGKTAVWLGQLARATHDNNLLRVRFKTSVDSRFVCLFMSQGIGRASLQNSVSATTSVAAIYWRNLVDYRLPIAPPEEQKRIRRALEMMEARVQAEESQLSKLHSLKRGLAHDLLTGRVRVKI